MKKARKHQNRSHCLCIRLTTKELEIITKRQQATTCPSVSFYIRQLVFKRRIIKTVRNLTEDSVMEKLSTIQRQFEELGLYALSNDDTSNSSTQAILKVMDDLNSTIKTFIQTCFPASTK